MDYLILLAILIINFTVSQMGLFVGYTVNGVAVSSSVNSGAPGILGIIEWVWDSLGFMWNLITFQVDDIPSLIGAIFLIIQLMLIFIIIKLIRGS